MSINFHPAFFNLLTLISQFINFIKLMSNHSDFVGILPILVEGSPVLWTCEIQCARHMISMKKLRFSSHLRTKVRHRGPPGSARARPCLTKIDVQKSLKLQEIDTQKKNKAKNGNQFVRFSEHFEQNCPLKTLEISFQNIKISKFSWGNNSRPPKWLTRSTFVWFVCGWKISPFCILKKLDSLISSVKRWFGRLFQSLMIFTKKKYLRELKLYLISFASCMDGWL